MHEIFHYPDMAALRAELDSLGITLPLSDDTACLFEPITIAERTLPNRIALQPMEGTDGGEDGSIGELTARRYRRFAQGGAALIWFEAVATAPELRASAHQLYLNERTVDSFARLVEEIRETGLKKNGFAPMLIMQATNSGRYAKPHGYPEPLIAYNNAYLEGDTPIDGSRILTDDQLKGYSALYEKTAALAKRAGFDGIDVKCCHRYLASELLSAYNRPGLYGGSLENRTRFLLDCYRAARAGAGEGFILTSRMNVYDGFVYPYGFGVTPETGLTPVLDEAKTIVARLRREMGIPLIDITIGNPYKNPHVNRPYDHGAYTPDEHPLVGVKRLMDCVTEIQKSCPELPVIGSGFSYLRQHSAQLAAGMIKSGGAALAGFGRMAFAYPDFPNDLRQTGSLDANKVCLTCGQCAALLRQGIPAGCVVRDREVYQAGGKAK